MLCWTGNYLSILLKCWAESQQNVFEFFPSHCWYESAHLRAGQCQGGVPEMCSLISIVCHQLCVRGACAAGALAVWEDQDAGSVWQSWLQSGAPNPLFFRLCIKHIFELLQAPALPAPNHEVTVC